MLSRSRENPWSPEVLLEAPVRWRKPGWVLHPESPGALAYRSFGCFRLAGEIHRTAQKRNQAIAIQGHLGLRWEVYMPLRKARLMSQLKSRT